MILSAGSGVAAEAGADLTQQSLPELVEIGRGRGVTPGQPADLGQQAWIRGESERHEAQVRRVERLVDEPLRLPAANLVDLTGRDPHALCLMRDKPGPPRESLLDQVAEPGPILLAHADVVVNEELA